MLRFDHALIDGMLVSKSMTENITEGKVKQDVGGMYGFGFIDAEYGGKRWFGHGGIGPGSFFKYAHFPESGFTIICFANHNATAACLW